MDADQNLWVSGFSSSKLWKLNGATGALMKAIDPRAQTGLVSYIYGIAIGPGGFIYTSDIQNGILMKIDPSKATGTEVVGTAPHGVRDVRHRGGRQRHGVPGQLGTTAPT